MAGERGQAASDYVAVVLVAAVVALGVATAAGAVDGSRVAGAVQRQMARALCVVASGRCEVDRAPCVVAQHRTVSAAGLTVAILHIGHERVLLREERSDGTVAVTLIDRGEPGLEIGLGVKGKLSLAGRGLAVGGEIAAAAVAQLGTGRTWIAPDGRAADALVERVGATRPSELRSLPPADQTFDDHGLSVSASAQLTGASVSVEAADVFGTRTDRRTGQVTAYVRRRNRLAGALATTSKEGERSEQYAVTLDREGRALDLVVLAAGTSTGSTVLDATSPKAQATGSAGVHQGAGRAWTTETHLDLTDPGNLVAARAFLAQVRTPEPRLGDVVRVSAELRRLLDAFGVVHARTLEVEQDGVAVGGSVALGVKVGLEVERSTQSTRVVEASTKGVDGVWREREECVSPR